MTTTKTIGFCAACIIVTAFVCGRHRDAKDTDGMERALRDVAWLTQSIRTAEYHGWNPVSVNSVEHAGAGWNGCYVLSWKREDMDVDESDWRLYFRIRENGTVVPLGTSGGWQHGPDLSSGDPGIRDLFQDVDGDGTNELVCPNFWGADGQTRVDIFRLSGDGSEVCGGNDLIAALCPGFAPSNQTWGGAMSCTLEWDRERHPDWWDDPGPLLFVCDYEVPLAPEDIATNAHAYAGVSRTNLLKNLRLPFVPFRPNP